MRVGLGMSSVSLTNYNHNNVTGVMSVHRLFTSVGMDKMVDHPRHQHVSSTVASEATHVSQSWHIPLARGSTRWKIVPIGAHGVHSVLPMGIATQ